MLCSLLSNKETKRFKFLNWIGQFDIFFCKFRLLSYWNNCCPGPSSEFVLQIEPHLNSLQYPLINHLVLSPFLPLLAFGWFRESVSSTLDTVHTGNSLSEALILASITQNMMTDCSLNYKLTVQENYKFSTCCGYQIGFFGFVLIFRTIWCTQRLLKL